MNSSIMKNHFKFNNSKVIDLDKSTLEKINFIINDYLEKLTKKDMIESTDVILGSITLIAETYDYLENKKKWDKYLYRLMNKLRNQMANGMYINQLSLHGGLSEIGLTVYILNKETGYYGKFLNTINLLIIEDLPKILNVLNKNTNNLMMFHYDAIVGISGIIRYLLHFSRQPEILSLIKYSLAYLIKITRDIKVNGYEVPGWYISRENQFRDDEKEKYKNGNFNYGLSHGIAGVLDALSLCYKENIIIDGQKEAIEKIIKQYKNTKMLNNEGIPFWPRMYSFEEYTQGKLDISIASYRMSWCYGSIGILRALKISAIALNDQSLKEWVSNKVNLISKMNIKDYDLESPILCHGYSGLMLLLITEYKETENSALLSSIKKLLQEILNCYDENSVYGFTDLESFIQNHKLVSKKVDDNSFLSGTSGVMLALISTFKHNIYFDRQLLIN